MSAGTEPCHEPNGAVPLPSRQAGGRTTHTPDGKYAFELSEAGMLGSGAHGVVRAALELDTKKWVAVKVMPASVLGAVAKELIAQKKVDHPNIVKLLGTQVDLDRRRVYMVMVRARSPPPEQTCERPPERPSKRTWSEGAACSV